MSTLVELPIIEHAQLRAVVAAWAELSPTDQCSWSGVAASAYLRDAVATPLEQAGVARIALMDSPSACSLASLERLVQELVSQIGFLVPQTYRGNLISRIRDEGHDYAAHQTRGHQTRAALSFHSDRSDLSVLLYVRAAARGGQLSVVSYQEAASELEHVDPDALATLHGDVPFDLRDERIFIEPRWTMRPVLWRSSLGQRGHYIRRFIEDSQRHINCPRLSESQVHALDSLDKTLETLRPLRTFAAAAGELLILNNYRVTHARTAFRDHDDSSGRLALRVWVAPYESESLPDFLLPIAGAVEPGCYRGGVGRDPEYHAMLGRTRRPEAVQADVSRT
jgi:hypothetical protein